MSEFHTAFATALRGGAAGGLKPWLAAGADGLAVYRNNAVSAAVEALSSTYPAVSRLVGEAFFRAMARGYWRVHPPRARSLLFYGEAFADFIASFEAASGLPYLPDVARIDRAWIEGHHAPESRALTATNLTALGEAGLGALRPGLRPCVRLLNSDFPAYAIWRTNREDETVTPIRLDHGAQTALVMRRGGEVTHRETTAAEHAYLTAVRNGASLQAAADAAAPMTDGDIVTLFIDLLGEGVFNGEHSHETQ